MKPNNRFAGDKPENMESKLLIIFVIDNSAAMTAGKMESVNNFLNSFYRSIQKGDDNPFSMDIIDKIDLSIVTYSDSVQTLRKASCIKKQEVAPRIKRSTNASTCVIAALNEALDIIEERKEWYREIEQGYYRPSIYLFSAKGITDTESEEYISLRNRVLEDYRRKRYRIFNTCLDSTAGSDLEQRNEIWLLTIHSLHELSETINMTNNIPYDNLSIITPKNEGDAIDISDESWLGEFDV